MDIAATRSDFAVVIGIGKYPNLRDVPEAEEDARRFADWLKNEGIHHDNLSIVLTPASSSQQRDSTRSDIEGAFNQLLSRVSGDDGAKPAGRRLYIYVSGHGYSSEPDSLGLLMSDASPQFLSAIDVVAYASAFRQSGLFREVVLIADCSGDELGRAIRPAPPPWRLPVSPGRGAAYFYALAGGPAISTPDAAGVLGGVLTRAVLEGLEGAAALSDGSITSDTLAQFVAKTVFERSEGRQQPVFRADPGRPIVFREATVSQAVGSSADSATGSGTSDQTAATAESSATGGTPASTSTPVPPVSSWTSASPTPRISSDRWATQDKLGYDPFARTIATLITHDDTVPPLTIGIKAPWGAGKTSLMKHVQYLLDGTAPVTEENEAARRTRSLEVSVTLGRMLKTLKALAQAAPRLEATEPSKDTTRQQDRQRSQRVSSLLESLQKAVGIAVGSGRAALEQVLFKPPVPVPSQQGTDAGIDARLTIWFNAWKYQTSEQIWAGLAHCIISQVTARMSAVDRESFWLRLHAARVDVNRLRWELRLMVLKELLPWLVFFGIVAVGGAIAIIFKPLLGLLGLGTSAVLALATYWIKWSRKLAEKASGKFKDLVREPDYEGKLGFLHLVESDMREVLDLVATQKKPLVVFVDDLDRCAPHKVSEVIEAINLFLSGDYPNCIFVLGMEPAIVAAALEVANKDLLDKVQAFGLADGHAPLGWRFMEKIIQLPLAIPSPDTHGSRAYLAHLTGGTGQMAATTNRETWASQVSGYIETFKAASSIDAVVKHTEALLSTADPSDKAAIAEASKRAYAAKFTDRDPAISRFIEQTLTLFQGNPRQLKRYVNVFRFFSTLRHHILMDRVASGVTGAPLPGDEALTKFIALNVHWPQAGDYLRQRRSTTASATESVLATLEKGARDLAGSSSDAADVVWEKYLKALQIEAGPWLKSRQFREFLAQGEQSGDFAGCGLW